MNIRLHRSLGPPPGVCPQVIGDSLSQELCASEAPSNFRAENKRPCNFITKSTRSPIGAGGAEWNLGMRDPARCS